MQIMDRKRQIAKEKSRKPKHTDAKQDSTMLKKKVKKSCLK